MPLARLLLLLMAAGLPLVVSFTLKVEPLAPKLALWTAAGGLLLALPLPPLGFSRPAALLLILAAALSFLSPAGATDLLPYLVGFAIYARARQNAWSGDFTRRYLFLTVTVALLVALNGLSQAAWNRLFTDVRLLNPFGNRVLSTLGNPTFLADYLALHLPLALYFALTARSTAGFALLAPVPAVIGLGIVFSGSKGGALAAAAGGAFLLATLLKRGRLPWARVAVLLVLSVAGIAATLRVSGVPLLALSRWTASADRFSFIQRANILRGSLDLLLSPPLAGHGPGSFPVLFPRHEPPELLKSLGITLSVNHAHNDFMEVACDLGPAGLALLLAVFWFAFSSAAPPRLAVPLRASLVAMAVSMSTNFFLFLPSSAFFLWMHAGLLETDPGRTWRHPRTSRWAFLLLACLMVLVAARRLAATGWYDMGAAGVEAGQGLAAGGHLAKAAALNPRERHVWQHLGRAAEIRGDWKASRDAYLRAWELAPWHAITSLNVGRAARSAWLMNRHDNEALNFALVFLGRASQANPWSLDARLWGGDMALKTGATGMASLFFAETPEGFPATAEWRFLRAEWLADSGDKEGAARERENARVLQARERLRGAEEALGAGRTAEAEKTAREITRSMPGLPAGWETLGFILHSTGRLAEAATCYERLAKLEPVSVAPRLNLALIALARRDFNTARIRIDEAARLSPDGVDVHLTRARLFASEGRIPQAKEEYGWVLDRDPSNQPARAELARLAGR